MSVNTVDTVAKGAAGLRKAGRLSYENESIRQQIQKVASVFAAAENAETNLFRYKNGMVAFWMVEVGEQALVERANYKAEALLRAYIELDRRCSKVTGKHVLPFTNDASVVKEIVNLYLTSNAAKIAI